MKRYQNEKHESNDNKKNLFQCPHDSAIKCSMESLCFDCEYYSISDNSTPNNILQRKAQELCFVCCQNIENKTGIIIGQELLCEKCYIDYWEWVLQGNPLKAYRGASTMGEHTFGEVRDDEQ